MSRSRPIAKPAHLQSQSELLNNTSRPLISPKSGLDSSEDVLIAIQYPNPSHFERLEYETQNSGQLAQRIRAGKQDFNFFTEALSYDVQPIPDISQVEIIATSPNNNVISVRNSDSHIELYAVATLTKIGAIESSQVKAMCTTHHYLITGNWNCKLSIFNVTQGF